MQRVSSPTRSQDEATTSEVGTERFSGLRITNRKVPARRWDELMRGKKFVTFNSLSTSLNGSASDNVVAIGLVYEKSLPKTSSNGNRFSHWCLTDLSFPQPRLMTLLLYGDAFEAWAADLSQKVPMGSMFAILNPGLLGERSGSQDEKKANGERVAIKVTHATQLVHLGTCPSLGLCGCKKKDGMPCSMPVDKERDPSLVCFYHTMSSEAEKIRRFGNAKRSSGDLTSKASARPAPGNDGIFVLPSRQAGPKSLEGLIASKIIAGTNSAAQGSDMRIRSAPSAAGGGDESAMRRLLEGGGSKQASKTGRPPPTPQTLKGKSSRLQEAESKSSSSSSTAASSSGNSFPAQKSPPDGEGYPKASPSSGIRDRQVAPPPDTDEAASSFLARQIMSKFKGGIPAPNPNKPMQSMLEQQRAKPALPSSRRSESLGELAAAVSEPKATRGSHSAPSRFGGASAADGPLKPAGVSTTSGIVAAGDDVTAASVGESGKAKATVVKLKKGVTKDMVRKWEAEFGKKIALQLAQDADPRKDMVRMKESRFQGVIDQERHAKRMRRLAELEAEDAALEKMAELTSIMVSGYRCKNCIVTYDNDHRRRECEEKGHEVTRVEVQRTRWECSHCSASHDVLDRQLPGHCFRCKGLTFKQVSLRKIKRTAPMEKDFFLPRGEELPFLNSIFIPGQPATKRFKEAREDYEGL
eukprot:TRINITY_DN15804_c0_g1_i2.p1 TRINITY_DN15804_c0_g1~~TRINITY_DN15804_c0_g1_i2.p1  ORF type:complete len:696 (+),score=146.49 TRINITY_DN15804_c0_g1_i2:107-2194(+)